MGDYSFADYQVAYAIGQQRRVNGQVALRRGDYFGGQLTSLEGNRGYRSIMASAGVRPPSPGHAAVAVRAEPACLRPPFPSGRLAVSCGAYRASTPLRGVEARGAAHPRGGGGTALRWHGFRYTGGDTMAPMGDVQPPVGYSDLLVMPDDGRRYEIHGGELVVVPSPMPAHQIVAVEILTLLNDYRRRSGGLALVAPLDIVFDEHDVVQPDVVFFRAERRQLVQPFAVTRAAPDIAVEVLSPSTAAVDRGRKMRMFAYYGVPEVWLVDPVDEQIEVHVLADGAYRRVQTASAGDTVRSVLLPDLTFDAARVFTFA